MIIMDGKKSANKIKMDLKDEICTLLRPPVLACVLVGENEASKTYVKMKKAACSEVGIVSRDILLEERVSERELLEHIQALNNDEGVDGILVQLPLPSHISAKNILMSVAVEKDVDGFHPYNVGKLLIGEDESFVPCTPLGIHKLLLDYGITPAGKHVVIIGRSNIVGKPLAALLMQKHKDCDATVTVAHSRTPRLQELTLSADILIGALGSPHFIKASMVKKGAVVIDVGINRSGGKITGDVDFENVAPLCSYITPVPGGVGPMTIACLLKNTVKSCVKKNNPF